jgi:hypothetical protein
MVDDDHVWRQIELSDLRDRVQRAKSAQELSTAIRTGITLTYAHWEGFVKSVSTYVLLYIAKKGYSLNELSSNYVALHFMGQLNSNVSSYRRIDLYMSMIDELGRLDQIKLKKSIAKYIETGGNLNSERFRDIVLKVGLDYGRFVLNENFIDVILLKSRNEIAHGRYVQMSRLDYLEAHDRVSQLIRNYKNEIQNFFLSRDYLR